MVFSVLTMWGQSQSTTASKNGIQDKYEYFKQNLKYFQENKENVISQAANLSNAANITSIDKSTPLLDEIYDGIQEILDNWTIIDQHQDKFSQEIEKLKVFIDKYYVDITYTDPNNNRTIISIGSRDFYSTALGYQPDLKDFRNKIHEYSNEKSKINEASKNSVIVDSNSEKEIKGNNEVEDENKEKKNDTTWSEIFCWMALIISLISIILSFTAFALHSRSQNELKDMRKKNKSYKEKLANEINVIKEKLQQSASNTTPNVSSKESNNNRYKEYSSKYNQTGINYGGQLNEEPPTFRANENSYNSPNEKSAPVSVENPHKNLIHLYATVNVNSSLPEFFKVTSEKTSDKLFELTLVNPDDEVAGFTVIPDLSPNFLRDVILNRDTYLPTTFCDKQIKSENPTQIMVQETGRAKKDGNIWRVTDRMVIKLI